MSRNSRPRASGKKQKKTIIVPKVLSNEDVAEAVGSAKAAPLLFRKQRRTSLSSHGPQDKAKAKRKVKLQRKGYLSLTSLSSRTLGGAKSRGGISQIAFRKTTSQTFKGLRESEGATRKHLLALRRQTKDVVFVHGWLLSGDANTLFAFLLCCSERPQFFGRAVSALVMAYRVLLEPGQLFDIMEGAHKDPSSIAFTHKTPGLVRSAVLVFLKCWFRTAFTDFSSNKKLFSRLDAFLSEELPLPEYHQLQLLYVRKLKDHKIVTFDFPDRNAPSSADITERVRNVSRMLMDFPSSECMRALAYIDTTLYKNLNVQELATQGANSPGMIALSDRFNQVSFGVSSCILLARDSDAQLRLLKKFCDIAVHAYNARYFNTVAACVAGFTSHDVSRLRLLWRAQNDAHVVTVRQLERMVSGVDNYRQFRRKHTEALASSQLQTPFFAIYIRDLVGLQENAAVSVSQDVIGLRAFLQMGEALQAVMLPQSWLLPMADPEAELLAWVLEWPCLSREEMQHASDEWKHRTPAPQREPRKVSSRFSLLEDKGRPPLEYEAPSRASAFIPHADVSDSETDGDASNQWFSVDDSPTTSCSQDD